MKKIIVLFTMLVLLVGYITPSFAMTDEQATAIQALLEEACKKSGVPGMSVSIVVEDEVLYFSSGYADREKGIKSDENTLYELASVSKAFTGLGILLLEEQGLLSMDDPVQKYLPWLTLKYQGKAVDMSKYTLNQFLHHTSGLVNGKHTLLIPRGDTEDMLKKTIEILVDVELAFPVGERYQYGTVNYDVLGLVIEVVSAQRYEEYMKTQVFEPLGLNNTYLYKEEALANGQVAKGYRTYFFQTFLYDAPMFGGNKPAGYIMSSTKDMARWLGIQMGTVKDIPEGFFKVIERSHQGNTTVEDVEGMYYAAGWEVNEDRSIVEHSGGNPNFATRAMTWPNEKIAICLLTNGEHTNIDIAVQIKEIIAGNLQQSYKFNVTQTMDIVLSSICLVFLLLTAVAFWLGVKRRKANRERVKSLKRTVFMVFWILLAIASCSMLFMTQILFSGSLADVLVWFTYSTLGVVITFVLFSAAMTWYVSG